MEVGIFHGELILSKKPNQNSTHKQPQNHIILWLPQSDIVLV